MFPVISQIKEMSHNISNKSRFRTGTRVISCLFQWDMQSKSTSSINSINVLKRRYWKVMGDVAAHFGHSAPSKETFFPNRDHAFSVGCVMCKIINVLVAIIDVFCHSGRLVFISHPFHFNLTSTPHRVIVLSILTDDSSSWEYLCSYSR